MRARERDALIIALSAAAAGLDAWSYFALGHIFVANMTGTTVLLGFSVFGGSTGKVLMAAESLCSYAAGTFVGSLLARPIRAKLAHRSPAEALHIEWPRRATLILLLECALVVVAAAVNLIASPAEASGTARLLVGTLAFAVGLQSTTVNALQLPGVVTTYITGTWTTLSSGLAQLVNGEKSGGERKPWTERLTLEAMVLASYLGSALVCGLIYRSSGRAEMGCYPAALLLLVVGGAVFRLLRPAQP